MKNLFKYFFCIILLFNSSCDIPNVTVGEKFSHSVLFNLVSGEKKQKFYIYKIIDNVEKYDSIFYQKEDIYFERTANITLLGRGFNFDSFIIHNDSSKSPFVRNLSYTNSEIIKLETNTNYNLEITINGGKITGMTKIPSDYNILQPKNNSVLKFDKLKNENNVNIKWSKSNGAKGYILKIIQNYVNISYQDSTIVNGISKESFVTQDTTLNFVSSHGRGTLQIDVLAYDENYHNHFVEFVQSAGIEGAYGYFGSSLKKSVTVNIEE